MASLIRLARAWMKDPRLRELLWFCAPALLIGLALRVWLTVSMPYGFYHSDTADFLVTTKTLFEKGDWKMHPKKTFLVPAFFTASLAVPGLPSLIAIPMVHHLAGLVLIFLVGVLVRLWIPRWRVFIIPVTAITAASPVFIWFEHTIIAETFWVTTTALAAVVATMFWKAARRPGDDPAAWQEKPWFIVLCFALVLQAGARPEGKLFFLLGLVLAFFAYWRTRQIWWRIIPLLAVAAVTHLTTKTSQAGVLLYTSVAYMMPDRVYTAPGIEPLLEPVIQAHRKGWEQGMAFPRARERQLIASIVQKYYTERGEAKKGQDKREINKTCLRLAMETCARRWWLLPRHVYYKFRHSAAFTPSDDFSERRIWDQQIEDGFGSDWELAYRLSDRLTGQKLNSEEEIGKWVRGNYDPKKTAWFNTLAGRWEDILAAWRLPDTYYGADKEDGIPYYMLAAFASILLMMFRPGELRPFHIIWGLFILWFAFIVFLTANVKPRFRFFFEPFWWIYLALLLDMVISIPAALFRRTTKEIQ